MPATARRRQDVEVKLPLPAQLGREITASVVVFLVALPLALGVAIASGVPVALGIVSAVVGGVVVGALAGCRLQVTGPAAGLIVLVWMIVDTWGVGALGVAVLASGAVQLAAGVLRLGRWFRAVSPATVYGLLAGIGGLIVLGQLHVMLGAVPPGGGLADLMGLPDAFALVGTDAGASSLAVGLVTIASLAGWDGLAPGRLRKIPSALVAIAVATAMASALSLPVAFVELPSSFGEALNVPVLASFALLLDPSFLAATAALTGVAAVESLLSAAATDQLHDGPRTDLDKELRALGIGNLVCGVLGALPVTGVIVRSAANVKAGAKTRLPAVLHGVWLAGLVLAAPFLLELLPIPALAGLLIYVGGQLIKPYAIKQLRSAGQGEIWVYLTTAIGIVVIGLLPGLVLGFVVALLKLLYTFGHLEVDSEADGDRHDVNLRGAATFIALPKLAEALEAIPSSAEAHVHIGGLIYVDHASHALLLEHERRLERGGGRLVTEWDDLIALGRSKPALRLAERTRDDPPRDTAPAT